MNIADRLTQQAAVRPDALAIASPVGSWKQRTNRRYSTLSLADLDRRSTSIAAGLQGMGIGPGKRIALLVRFGEDFITLVFALLKAGATMVLVDPGMGKKNLIRCLEATEPDGFIAIPMAHAIVRMLQSRFPKAKHNVLVGRWFPGLPSVTLSRLEGISPSAYRNPIEDVHAESAVIFTTGSTGPPKGVLYTHQTFHAQVDLVAERFGIVPGGRDLSCFPLFGLFNAVMGTATILPDMDPTRPADVDPPRLLDAIEQWNINQSFGSPALWTRMGNYCQASGRTMKPLQLVLSAGAPVPPRVLQSIRNGIDPNGRVFTPYGATEALPIASIESREVLDETAAKTAAGRGTCVGSRFPTIEWKVIRIRDDALHRIDETEELRRGEIGELMVSGPIVSQRYVTRMDQNPLHKVFDGERVWHRMGDVGYLDEQERFWFCGRKAHRVVTRDQVLFTEPIEAIANGHPEIYRSALVGVGPAPNQVPWVILEPWNRSSHPDCLVDEVTERLKGSEVSHSVEKVVVYPTKLPTDIRHNSKIFREQLAVWAQRRSEKK
jgi:acyl-CoA synthetase (AMP-forming)/AMP-acid ligase II